MNKTNIKIKELNNNKKKREKKKKTKGNMKCICIDYAQNNVSLLVQMSHIIMHTTHSILPLFYFIFLMPISTYVLYIKIHRQKVTNVDPLHVFVRTQVYLYQQEDNKIKQTTQEVAIPVLYFFFFLYNLF